MFKKFLFATAAMAIMASPAMARSHVDVVLNFAPPQERVEYIPEAPQPDVVWVPGYWAWSHGQYYWVDGRYVQARPGYFWVADDWVQYGRSWRHVQGHWERQRFPDHNEEWREHHEEWHDRDAWHGHERGHDERRDYR